MRSTRSLTGTLFTAAIALAACGKKDDGKAKAPPAPPPEAKPTPPAPTPTPLAPTIEAKDVGFATPESVYHDIEMGAYLVSNINGAPTALDDNGFITRLGLNGRVAELKWIDGARPDVTLNAPKGMTKLGSTLYVADVTAVRMFDATTGAPKGSIDIPGATFLNDLDAADGKVYVTDSGLNAKLEPSGTDAVYSIDKDGKVEKIASGPELKAPNGVTVLDGAVWIAPFGDRSIYRLVDGKPTEATALPAGGLDGIGSLLDGRLVVASWEGKAVYAGKPGGAFTPLVENIEAPADLCVDNLHDVVVVPMFMANAVRMYPVK